MPTLKHTQTPYLETSCTVNKDKKKKNKKKHIAIYWHILTNYLKLIKCLIFYDVFVSLRQNQSVWKSLQWIWCDEDYHDPRSEVWAAQWESNSQTLVYFSLNYYITQGTPSYIEIITSKVWNWL